MIFKALKPHSSCLVNISVGECWDLDFLLFPDCLLHLASFESNYSCTPASVVLSFKAAKALIDQFTTILGLCEE